MNHFTVIKIVNLVAGFMFLVMGGLLITSFTANLSVVQELQQAANFDNWKFFIILAGIVALLICGVLTLGSLKEFQMCRSTRNSVVAEAIYILGLGLESTVSVGVVPSIEASKASSMQSIFGFGHDDNLKWTYAGRKPLPIENPAVGDDAEDDTKEKDEAK